MQRKTGILIGVCIAIVFFAFGAWATYYDIYGTNALLKGDLYVTRNADLMGSTVIRSGYLEGATEDAYEMYITVEDPTADRTATLPDYTGAVPIVLDQSGTSQTIGNETAEIADSAVTPPASWWVEGKTLKWEMSGSIGGTNAAKVFNFWGGGSVLGTVTTPTTAQGEYVLTATVQCVDDQASGVSETGELELRIGSGGTDYYVDTATSTVTGFATGVTSFRLEVTSGNAGDLIYKRALRIWNWFKS